MNAQGTCKLLLEDRILSGNCENSNFTYFEMNVDLEELDSTRLFDLLPSNGFLRINNGPNDDVKYALTKRAGFSQILFKSRSGWFTMDKLLISKNGLTFYIDHDPDVLVAESDLRIIRKTKDMLKDRDSWHKNDDRDCEDDIQNNSFSLFCALKSASIEIEGDYNHRNAIMQKIRHTIVKLFPNKKWEHRLRDFNNMPETDFIVLMDLLNRVERDVISELEQKK